MREKVVAALTQKPPATCRATLPMHVVTVGLGIRMIMIDVQVLRHGGSKTADVALPALELEQDVVLFDGHPVDRAKMVPASVTTLACCLRHLGLGAALAPWLVLHVYTVPRAGGLRT